VTAPPAPPEEGDEEDRRLRRVWPGCIIAGAALAAMRSRGLIHLYLAYSLAVAVGVVAAAFEARDLRRQIAYSIPFILVGIGELWLCAVIDARNPKITTNREFMSAALCGSVPGIALYALVRWRL
jgi:hypothetical protein